LPAIGNPTFDHWLEGATMSIGVLAMVGLSHERVAALTEAGYVVREGKKYPNRIDAVRDAGESVRAVLTNGRGGLTGEEMAFLPKLEVICAVGAGYEAVDLDTARKRNIAVANCPDTNASTVADSAVMLLMAATRHIRQADRHVHEGGWQDQWRVDTQTISGKRLGVLGMGTIGTKVANRGARGFDMEVGYHNRKAVSGSPYRYFEKLIDLAAWADFLVCAAPGGAGTRHLVNADVLAALGPKGYVVNVGRGTVIDTAALIDALKAKRIAGAGLDVLEGEPAIPPILPELLTFENVVITPHCAGRSPEARTAATATILGNLNAFFAGKPLLTPVSPKT
jgi:lactate dehydrogenase-like 2-hydroxyacid dehydrogenase